MAWFAVFIIGTLKVLGVLEIPVEWIVIASGIALLYDWSRKAKFIRA